MAEPTTWEAANERLQRAGKPVPSRKIANNTYLQRRGEHDIAVKFHDTDIVLFRMPGSVTHEHGEVVLNTGGWLTKTTSERINRYLPGTVSLSSHRGRWYLHGRGNWNHDDWLPYTDGATILVRDENVTEFTHLADCNEVTKQDAHNRRINRLITNYLKWMESNADHFPSLLSNREFARPCGMCVRTAAGILVGDSFEDKQHLIEHLMDNQVPWSVWLVACDQARKGDGTMRARIYPLAKRDLVAYLRGLLYVGPVASANGRRPAHTLPWGMDTREEAC